VYVAAGATVNWPVQALVLVGGIPAAGQSVTWQSATGILAPTGGVLTNAVGVAAANLTVGVLAEGQTVSTKACIAGGTTCVTFNAFGSRPGYGWLAAISGTKQSLIMGSAAAVVGMRLLDMNGNPMAGGTVAVHQSLYSWSPPCPIHGRCVQARLLATQNSTAISALDGSLTVVPLAMAGQATTLAGKATTGNAGTMVFTVEEHP